MFQYYSKNGKVKYQGENVTNYDRPEFDRLFEEFRGMDLDADRQQRIDAMVALLRHDAPVLAGWHNEAFLLSHAWFANAKPGKIIHSNRQYYSIDVARRAALRAQWNRPVLWPLGLTALLMVMLVVLALRHYRHHESRTAREETVA